MFKWAGGPTEKKIDPLLIARPYFNNNTGIMHGLRA